MSKSGDDVRATCHIILESEKKGYNPRDDVKGYVELSNDENLVFCGCKVALEGNVKVNFKDDEVTHSRTESVVKKFIFIGGDGKTKTILTPPKTIFQFCIQLPYTSIPGSYKGTHGTIVYQIVVYLSNGYSWIRGGEKEVKVNSVLELPRPFHTLIYEKNMPVTLPEKNRKGPRLKFILRCDQGPIVYDGESITFIIQVENHTEIPVKDIGVVLMQYVTYKCGPYKVTKNVIAIVRAPTPMATFWKGSLTVPKKTRPSQSGLISIEYFIKVKMIIENQSASNLTGETPFTVCSKRNLNLNPAPKSRYGTARTRATVVASVINAFQSLPQSPASGTTRFPKLVLSNCPYTVSRHLENRRSIMGYNGETTMLTEEKPIPEETRMLSNLRIS